MQREAFGIEVQPQHAQCSRRPRQKAKGYPQDRRLPCHRIARRIHGANAPRAHAQSLPAAQPIKGVIAGDDEHQSRAINIDPGPCGGGDDRRTMSEKQRAAGEYHQQSREKKSVVNQCRDSASESGTGAADHGGGAVAGFFALESGDFVPGEAAFAPGEAVFMLAEGDFVLDGCGLGINSCSKGLNIAS